MIHIIAEAAHGGEGFLSETWELLQNPAHWVFEGITDIAFSVLIAWPIAAWKVRRHDRQHHEGHVS